MKKPSSTLEYLQDLVRSLTPDRIVDPAPHHYLFDQEIGLDSLALASFFAALQTDFSLAEETVETADWIGLSLFDLAIEIDKLSVEA